MLSTLVLLVASGCYVYEPAQLDVIPPSTEVRARLSARQVDALTAMESLPVEVVEDRLLEGILVASEPDSLLMEVPVAVANRPRRIETLNQRLRIPREEVLEMEVRRFDRTRTWLTAGAVAVAAGGIAVAIATSDSGGDAPPGGPRPPQEIRIPLRLLLGR